MDNRHFPVDHDSFPEKIEEWDKNSLIPSIGIIFLRDTIEDYKLKSLDYLTNLYPSFMISFKYL